MKAHIGRAACFDAAVLRTEKEKRPRCIASTKSASEQTRIFCVLELRTVALSE
jgi:hypothetical protein